MVNVARRDGPVYTLRCDVAELVASYLDLKA